MNTIDVSEIISEAWNFTKKHWLKMLLVNIFIAIVNFVISMLFMPSGFWSCYIEAITTQSARALAQLQAMAQSMHLYSNYIEYVIISMLELGVVNAVLLVVLGKSDTVKLRLGYNISLLNFFNILLGSIIFLIIVSIGTIFCVLPGIYLACRLMMYKYIILNENVNAIDALQRSWQITEDNGLKIFLLWVLLILINILGLILCCVGMFITYIITYFAIAICYKKLTEQDQVATTIIND